MEAFEYANPATLQEACSAARLAAGAKPQVLAGGTDLISLMKDYSHARSAW